MSRGKDAFDFAFKKDIPLGNYQPTIIVAVFYQSVYKYEKDSLNIYINVIKI